MNYSLEVSYDLKAIFYITQNDFLVTNRFFFCSIFLGPVIGLEFNGKNCVESTNEAVSEVCSNSLSNIYVSSTPEKALQDIDAFYNFVDMSMN